MSPGEHRVRLLASAASDAVCLIERMLTVSACTLQFSIDDSGSGKAAGLCRVAGWCWHPEEQIYALLIIAGGQKVPARYPLSRPDVAAVVPGAGEACGFEAYLALSPGRVEIALEARLCSGATVTVPASTLRVRGQSTRDRVAAVASSFAMMARRGNGWRRSRGRWPRGEEWPHLFRRARQELTRALNTGRPVHARIAPPAIDRYDAWLAVNAWTPAASARLAERLASSPQPLMSVIMPTFEGRPNCCGKPLLP